LNIYKIMPLWALYIFLDLFVLFQFVAVCFPLIQRGYILSLSLVKVVSTLGQTWTKIINYFSSQNSGSIVRTSDSPFFSIFSLPKNPFRQTKLIFPPSRPLSRVIAGAKSPATNWR
jgi:hypothetical protein